MSTLITVHIVNGEDTVAIEGYATLESAIAEYMASGWEDEPETLLRGVSTFTDHETGKVVAVITYYEVDGREWPNALGVIYHQGSIEVRRWARLETVDSYTAYRTF